MKRSELIVDFIDNKIIKAIERPRAFFPSVEAFESTIIELEDVRQFAVENPNYNSTNRYVSYLISKGLGAARFSSDDKRGFSDYVAFLEDYLQLIQREKTVLREQKRGEGGQGGQGGQEPIPRCRWP